MRSWTRRLHEVTRWTWCHKTTPEMTITTVGKKWLYNSALSDIYILLYTWLYTAPLILLTRPRATRKLRARCPILRAHEALVCNFNPCLNYLNAKDPKTGRSYGQVTEISTKCQQKQTGMFSLYLDTAT